MVKLFKLHKFFGLIAGLVILILGVTGFLLDHDKWSFLYTTSFKNVPTKTLENDSRLYNAYWIDKQDSSHVMAGSNMGIFESFDKGLNFSKISTIQSLAIREDISGVYSATSDGIYKYVDGVWNNILLKDEYITALALSQEKIVAVVDKEELVLIDKNTLNIISRGTVEIEEKLLQDDIKLSRFVRDLHYGRGLFDGDISLLVNDYGAIIMCILPITGYMIWWLIRRKNNAKLARKIIKIHANIFIVIAFIPITIVAITGIFLDHPKDLASFMRSVNISHSILPPVYNTLKSDIWSVDIDENIVRIGNRFGVYKSENLNDWSRDSKGFAYSMIRKDESLYVGGMGAPNRVLRDEWKYLKNTPHMFRDIIEEDKKIKYFSPHKQDFLLPKLDEATLFSLLYTLHNGEFFSSWWIWVNDFMAFALIILGITGTVRWFKKKKRTF